MSAEFHLGSREKSGWDSRTAECSDPANLGFPISFRDPITTASITELVISGWQYSAENALILEGIC